MQALAQGGKMLIGSTNWLLPVLAAFASLTRYFYTEWLLLTLYIQVPDDAVRFDLPDIGLVAWQCADRLCFSI
jgi:hypothetical protein